MFYRIKELREDKDIKQKDIAKILSVSRSNYANYESGTRRVPAEYLCQLADFYGVSVDYLLYRTDENKPYPKSRKLEKLKKLE